MIASASRACSGDPVAFVASFEAYTGSETRIGVLTVRSGSFRDVVTGLGHTTQLQWSDTGDTVRLLSQGPWSPTVPRGRMRWFGYRVSLKREYARWERLRTSHPVPRDAR